MVYFLTKWRHMCQGHDSWATNWAWPKMGMCTLSQNSCTVAEAVRWRLL